MARKALHIAWLGAGPAGDDSGGVPGVAADLLLGLARHGHRIDVFLPSRERTVPHELTNVANIRFVWGTSTWRWNAWYSRAKGAAWVSGLIARSLALLKLRRRVAGYHAGDPFDIIYQFCAIETLGVPSRVRRAVPLVLHPEIHTYGELRCYIAERRLSFRCQSRATFAAAIVVMSTRALIQRFTIRRARLVICVSPIFRDRLISDYGVPFARCAVVPNPVRFERFERVEREPEPTPTVLVLGRISARKGIEDIVQVARALLGRGATLRLRIVGGPSLSSDYTRLLDDLPQENSEYVGQVAPKQVPHELSRCDVLLQASHYEPFGLTVAEALASGLPVVATNEVGAIAGVDRSVVVEVQPGDIEGIATALTRTVGRMSNGRLQMERTARAEAERLFCADTVCEKISGLLERLTTSG